MRAATYRMLLAIQAMSEISRNQVQQKRRVALLNAVTRLLEIGNRMARVAWLEKTVLQNCKSFEDLL